ncbi:MAG TPA: PIG-L family deacetylase [Thermoanaerobaculia bacterium]|nr:PIG-L family deacetylase [Thermoanaerobaculia bacterium]
MRTLFVLAHQDDEIAVATRITYALQRGHDVSVVYLTNGEGRTARSAERDEESRQVLRRLGVHDMHFLGSQERIPDGALHEHLDRALALLERMRDVDEVVCLAWEGGHQDHDASHLIAAAFAKKRGLVAREMPLYQGYRLPGPFFQTMAPLGSGWEPRRIRAAEGMRIVALCRFYPSQRKTWIGLLPTAIVRLVLARKEWTRVADLDRCKKKPHEGRLYYERRFGVTWEAFSRHAEAFLTRS